jgi:hypothetical protein
MSPALPALNCEADADKTDSGDEADSLDDLQDLDNSAAAELFQFQFANQGQSVAVFYDEGFHIGQTLQIHSPELADISFMEQREKQNKFKWPASDAIEQVSARFVFFADFDILEHHRLWVLQKADWDLLNRRWHQFLRFTGNL